TVLQAGDNALSVGRDRDGLACSVLQDVANLPLVAIPDGDHIAVVRGGEHLAAGAESARGKSSLRHAPGSQELAAYRVPMVHLARFIADGDNRLAVGRERRRADVADML